MITAIVQARLSSTRLPKKILLDLGGKTILKRVIDSLKASKYIEDVIVATSTMTDDDKIVEYCKKNHIKFFRGELENVLDRFYQAAKSNNAKHICRVTSDCPLIDSEIVDQVAQKYLEENYDYVANNHPVSTFPDGMDAEVFSFKTLKKTWKEAKLKSEREHVTPYIWKNPEKFKIFNIISEKDLSEYRLTIDEPKDYELLQEIVSELDDHRMMSVIKFLDKNEDVKKINQKIIRDEGYAKSLNEDRIK